MVNEKRLIDANALERKMFYVEETNGGHGWVIALEDLSKAPTVDAMELPTGKPGDCLEWDNGSGFKQIYCIHAVMVCEDCIRYDLEKFAPVVDHKNIVRIMSREEAEKEWRNRVNDERKAEDYQSLKAVP